MAKDVNLTEGLEEVSVATEEKTVRARKEQTPEQTAEIVAGIAKMKEMGLSEKALLVLETLAPVWNASDAEAKQSAKETVIEAFGGSEALKDYADEGMVEDLQAFAGIARILPIANNIKSFYARRATSKKVKTTHVSISGSMYVVNAEYYDSLATVSKEEKRELILQHADTKRVDTEEI